MSDPISSRRAFLRTVTHTAAAVTFAPRAVEAQTPAGHAQDAVSFPPIHAATEQKEKTPGPFDAPDRRVGFAVVGLGRLAVNEILPAMGRSRFCRPAALVSGDPVKASKIAAQYGIAETALYDYESYDRLAQNPAVEVIYIVLPNSMHAEYTIRGAAAGKHILCEKPMATTATDCERMIAACDKANVKLMIAYRSQYEVCDLALLKMIRAGKMGRLRQMISTNSQNEGDPAQWRLKRAMAGGGSMPDVGIYCLNAARFLSNEEPDQVFSTVTQPKNDPRFAEVEASCHVIAHFPSGFTAIFHSAYDVHKSQFLRLEGTDAWAEMNPAFAYRGIKLRYATLMDSQEVVVQPELAEKDQFAAEMDHMAQCVAGNVRPHTPGEEGLQDQRITDAIYESARTGKAVKLAQPKGPVRGPDPAEG